ncbi:uncharacterized protein LOC131691893 [Topomyia yanbarensis]|uniref:uncharacterized protein LOC131691893 n=1 Tax=Topomyia yanbarensis TaxID=2498891 RepID=UPI00273C84EF|nr:uncharacterized protein LOC131691893 [Topomyia yanbarensis]
MSEWKLTKNEVLQLIQCYKEKECLWDLNSSLYKRIDMKKQAWNELSTEFNVSAERIKKKLKSLRTAFFAEKKKVDESKQNEIDSLIHVPSLFYYNDLSFIIPASEMRKCHRNVPVIAKVEELNIDETSYVSDCSPSPHELVYENSYLPYTDQEREGYPVKRKTSMTASASDDNGDVYTAFSKCIALQLKQLPALEATILMSEIQQMISNKTVQVLETQSKKRREQPVHSPTFNMQSYLMSCNELIEMRRANGLS